MATRFIATPVSTMSAFICREKYAMMSAMNIPVTRPHSMPTKRLPLYALPSTPVSAEKSMMPSKPMLMTPARSATRLPSAANRTGVVSRSAE